MVTKREHFVVCQRRVSVAGVKRDAVVSKRYSHASRTQATQPRNRYPFAVKHLAVLMINSPRGIDESDCSVASCCNVVVLEDDAVNRVAALCVGRCASV